MPAVKVLPSATAYWHIPEICYYVENEGRSLKEQERKELGITAYGCQEFHETGFCKHTLSKYGRYMKKYIERYNEYKASVLTLAKKAGFTLPRAGWSLYFYFPAPVRWSKKKKARMHGQWKINKPDTKNLLAGFEDSVSSTDEQMAQLSGLGKFWVNQPNGYIEILLDQPIYNPFGVEFIDQVAMSREPKRKYTITTEDTVGKKRGRKKRQQLLFSREEKIK